MRIEPGDFAHSSSAMDLVPKRDGFVLLLRSVCAHFEDDVIDVINLPEVPDVPGSVLETVR